MCDRIETLHVSTEGIVLYKNWPNLLITSSHDQSRDIKGPLFKALYRLNYIPDLVETLQVSTNRSALDKNWHDVLITSSRDQSHDIQGALFKPF